MEIITLKKKTKKCTEREKKIKGKRKKKQLEYETMK